MTAYLLKRLLLIIPTLFGIMLISFAIVQFAPGGPVEQVIAQISGTDVSATSRIGGSQGDGLSPSAQSSSQGSGAEGGSKYRGAQGLDPEFIKQLEKQFGFDKPAHERFLLMMKNYLTFEFGSSYFSSKTVLQLIREKLPVSISLGIWMTLITYLISIPLGIRKAMHDGERFDTWTSGVLVIGYAIPGFLVAVFLLVMFAGGSFFQWFPSRGLTSDAWAQVLGAIIGDGVVASGNELAVAEASPPAMSVRVNTGKAFIGGYYFEVHTGQETLAIAAAHATGGIGSDDVLAALLGVLPDIQAPIVRFQELPAH